MSRRDHRKAARHQGCAQRRSEEARLLVGWSPVGWAPRRPLLRTLARRLVARELHDPVVAPRIAPEPAGWSRGRAADQRHQALLLVARKVRAALVEVLVMLDEVRPVLAQPLHEDAPHLAAQVQSDAADSRRAG